MDESQIAHLRAMLAELELPPAVIEAEVARQVEAFATEISEGERVVFALQRKDRYGS